jgi:hypothetical protein
VLGFLVLLIPTTAMGATLPLLVKALCRKKNDFGRVLGYLYGFNTLGAMIGAVSGEAFLFQSLGLMGAGLFAALLDLLAAALCLALPVRDASPAQLPGEEAPVRPSFPFQSWRIRLLLAAGGLAGAALLGAEVLWFRFLRLFFPDTDLTFVVMLAVVLAGIGLGGVLAGALLSRWPERHDLAICLAGLGGVAFTVSYALFDPQSGGATWYQEAGAIIPLAIKLMFPTALVSGLLFTLIGQALHILTGTDIEAAAALTTANTLGAMVGALAAAFILLPGLGVEQSLWVIVLAYGGAFCLLTAALGVSRRGFLRPAWAGSVLLLVLALVLFPFGRMGRHLDTATEKFRSSDSSRTIVVSEGLTETLQ